MPTDTQAQYPQTFQFKCPQCKAKADMPWPQPANGYTGFCPVCGQPFVTQPPWVSKDEYQRAQYESRQRAATHQGSPAGPPAGQRPNPAFSTSPNASMDAISVANKAQRNEIILNVLWIVLGIIQCVALYTAVAGIWNIVIGILGLRSAKNIVAGNNLILPWYEGRKPWLIAAAAINLVLGAAIGLILVGLEWMMMDYVLKNRAAFEEPSVNS